MQSNSLLYEESVEIKPQKKQYFHTISIPRIYLISYFHDFGKRHGLKETNMKTKTMRKLVAFTTMLALSFSFSSTVLAAEMVGTSLTVGESGGLRPIVKAKWEMKGPSFNGTTYTNPAYEGKDDILTENGAQFYAPGVWGGSMNYTVCAIVTDPNGVADIQSVYADILFPTDRKMHVSPSDPTDPNYNSAEIDNPTGGCGAQIEENTLIKLSKDDGIDLFCNKIQLGNNGLPTWNPTGLYNYNEVCNPSSGQLYEETAHVYCSDKSLTWEHPAGNYGVEVSGVDAVGPGVELLNTFEYVEYAGFDVDFSNVQYKDVLLNVRNQVDGDRTFETSGTSLKPTVRNIGNTRLEMLVAQDDMKFGKRDITIWNVQYDARVGNLLADWNGYYYPFKLNSDPGNPTYAQYTDLMEILDLSETEKMDFAILVSKWSQGLTFPYVGSMWLDAEISPFSKCGTTE
jgi:hypothetical protein